jgi:DNA repair exonuclease SbcCD nuclease subunit
MVREYEYGVRLNRGTIIEVHIADLHFGAFNPKIQYQILQEQFLSKIKDLPQIDLISVDGDIFDHKVMSNSDVVLYASLFIDNLVSICRDKKATLILLHGTYSHDYDQLKMFYHYMDDKSVDVRVITQIQFEIVKGCRILCIPELYGVDESIYRHYFFESGWYDEAFVHGTFKGAVFGDNVGAGRLLTEEDFIYCTGVAISGHVHKGGCFNGFYYYCGCPYRWKFGEEEDKGFLILAHNLDTRYHYTHFEKIESFRYDTIFLDDLISNDPKVIIDYINNLQQTQGIDFIKVKVRFPVNGSDKTIINNYYRNNPNTFVEFMDISEIEEQKKEEQIKQDEEYSYLLDNSISDLDRFVMYINNSEGYEFITVDKLSELLYKTI